MDTKYLITFVQLWESEDTYSTIGKEFSIAQEITKKELYSYAAIHNYTLNHSYCKATKFKRINFFNENKCLLMAIEND